MTDCHLSDQQAQHCAQDPAAAAAAHAHLLTCVSCRHQVAVYQALFQDVAASPRPAVEAALRARVLAHLPAPRARRPWAAGLMSALLLGFVSGPSATLGPCSGRPSPAWRPACGPPCSWEWVCCCWPRA